jgi:hypothetical protein
VFKQKRDDIMVKLTNGRRQMKVIKYDVSSGVKRQQIKVKKIVVMAVASLGIISGAAIPAMAAGNSTPGEGRYDSNPGRQQAVEVGAQCGSGAGSGAFGYFGKDNNLAGGANGEQTGLNNSAVCGNRQSNP